MTNVDSGTMCRMTVHGPSGRIDLAVSSSCTVAELLPTLVRHTVKQSEWDSGWVLQRLGSRPLDPDGTPQTLDLLDGEQLYLRPVDAPLPELDFDDVADGLATAVNRRGDRWRPEVAKRFFLGLAAGVVVVVALALPQPSLEGEGGVARSVVAAGIAVLFAVGALLSGRLLRDGAVATMAGLAACGFAAVAGAAWPTGGGPVAASLVAVVCAMVVAWLMLAVRPFGAATLSTAVFDIVSAVGAVAVLAVVLYAVTGVSRSQAAGLTAVGVFAFVAYAPKVVIRMARVRGPQLPRSADEMRVDDRPEPAEQLLGRANAADVYLTVFAVTAAVVLPATCALLVEEPGWIGLSMVAVISGATLLRARGMLGVWQRVPLAVAGAVGLAMIALSIVEHASMARRAAVLAALLAIAGLLVVAARRPAQRRPLPIWGHVADVLEVLATVALVPLLLGLLGVYAMARGWAG